MKKAVNTIKGFEDFKDYYITSDGRVVSEKRDKAIELTPSNNGTGYLRITLSNNGQLKQTLVHRLVALAFVDGYAPELTVDHIDENKFNNNYLNLQWMTRGDNVAKSKNIRIVQKDLNGNQIKIWESMMEAERIGGFRQTAISQVCAGERKTHAGFIWKKVEEVI